MTVFIRLVDVSDKAAVLRRAVTEPVAGVTFDVSATELAAIQGSPFAYWIPNRIRQAFADVPSFKTTDRVAKHGGVTLDDFRFLRLWTEVPPDALGERFAPFAKGGPARSFYADIPMCVRWSGSGEELKAFVGAVRARNGWGDQWTAVLNGYAYYLRPGLTWPLRAVRFTPQILPSGCVFSARGYCMFAPADQLLPLLGLCSSRVFDYLFKVRLGGERPEYVVGVLEELPTPEFSAETAARLGQLAHEGWRIQRADDSFDERSRVFLVPEGVLDPALRRHQREQAEARLECLQEEIDSIVLQLYDFGEEERRHILSHLAGTAVADDGISDNAEDNGGTAEADTGVDIRARLLSWAIGVAFSRFDIQFATGERTPPPVPESFDALPCYSPGMHADGIPAVSASAGVLVDDVGHANDLPARVADLLLQIHAEVPNDLRAWVAKEFFPLHVKMYSKGRRKAPIYWQLATHSVSYSVWLYIHAFSKDTFFRVQNDYAVPKLAHEERRLESLTRELRDQNTAAQRKELAAQENLVEELRVFLEEVKRVAPLWSPNLDDGVIINFAPLWRLVPQNKSWQKELKSTWDALCEGKYDWAHLAIHLWPERVVPKCAQDRSLAIAHGLEDVFWAESTDGKWAARKTPIRIVEELVRERTSPAVKSALKSLLEAPAPAGNAGRGRGARRRVAAATEGGEA